jgi:acetoin utilization deacetylase AcuC-like enzyme
VALPDDTTDDRYLAALGNAIPQLPLADADCVFYLAGADPYREDQLGGLALSLDGLRKRDDMVLQASQGSGSAVAVALAGGYAWRQEDTVSIHAASVSAASESLGLV